MYGYTNKDQDNITEDFIALPKLSKQPPPPSSLFWTMWNTWKNVAEDTLNTDFVQGIKNGNLDPVVFGDFNVSDAYYCCHSAKNYEIAAKKAQDSRVKAFLLEKFSSYENYNATLSSTWHIQDGMGIVPSPVVKAYSAFERSIVNLQLPIYSVVCMLPCEHLWAWLGSQLSPPSDGNLYASWIKDNNYPDAAYAMGNFLDLFQKSHPGVLDPKTATDIYGTAMLFEFEIFKTA